MKLTTLCYIQKGQAYLMMHRIKKGQDVNKGKWIGVGGKFEANESPDECLQREVKEETGLTLTRYRARGILTFVYNDEVGEYIHVYTADGFDGQLIMDDEGECECDEGVLKWIPFEALHQYPLWAGDRIFLRLLIENQSEYFSLKLIYKQDELVSAYLNGQAVDVQSAIRSDLL